jgi:hypothetical protein
MRTNTNYLKSGFRICPEIIRENLLKAGKLPDETKMAFCGLWGLSPEGLNNLYTTLLTDDSDDDSDDDFQENPPSENSIKVRFSLFPNGLCVLADNGRFSRKHDNIRPTLELLEYSGLSEEQKQLLTDLIPPSSHVIAAGTLYLKQTFAEDGTTSVKIAGADSRSGHFRLTHSREVIQAYLHKIYPELIGPDFTLFDLPADFKPSVDKTRHINLTQDSGFVDWLGAINQDPNLSNLGHFIDITTKQLNPPDTRRVPIIGPLPCKLNFFEDESSFSDVPRSLNNSFGNPEGEEQSIRFITYDNKGFLETDVPLLFPVILVDPDYANKTFEVIYSANGDILFKECLPTQSESQPSGGLLSPTQATAASQAVGEDAPSPAKRTRLSTPIISTLTGTPSSSGVVPKSPASPSSSNIFSQTATSARRLELHEAKLALLSNCGLLQP